MNKINSCFSGKVNKIDKALASITKKKRTDSKYIKLRIKEKSYNWATEIQKIMRLLSTTICQ